MLKEIRIKKLQQQTQTKSIKNFVINKSVRSDATKLANQKIGTFTSNVQKRQHVVTYAFLAIAVAGVLIGNRVSSQQDYSANINTNQFASIEAPLDSLSASQTASAVATVTDMIKVEDVIEVAQAEDRKQDVASTGDNLISKPRAVATDTKTAKDITSHMVAEGENVKKIAEEYELKPETIMWANDLPSEDVAVGKQLTIPPVDGVIYEVKADDSPEKIAEKFSADRERIVSFNDAEISGLAAGEKIIVPDGKIEAVPVAQPATSRTQIASNRTVQSSLGSGYGQSQPSSTRGAVYAGNRYAYGHCTWHVANLRAAAGKPVPSFWGNGGQWGYNARKDGYTVSNEPQVGSIGVHVGGYGHVAYVTSVSGNMVHVKEMHGFRSNGIPMETDYPVSFFNGGFIY